MKKCNTIVPFLFLFIPVSWGQLCSGGSDSGYPCNNVGLMSNVSLGQMGGNRGNDVWGWRDPSTGRQYALMGLNNGTAFVDVTSASSPRVIGRLPTATSNSAWRDIKVYANHAFIVSEAANHGMQVFDLTRLRGAAVGSTFTADTTLTDLGNGESLGDAHNVVMDFTNGVAYPVGSNICSGGLVAIDVSTPKEPRYLGCFLADGYTHDAQIVQKGSSSYALACNENSVTVVNTTDPSNMTLVDKVGIPGSRYIHQGWATTNLNYFLVNDEGDETGNNHNTRTHVFDMRNINNLVYVGFHEATTSVIDHNLYTTDDYIFQANYQAGLQIFEPTDLANARLTRVGYFDTDTTGNNPIFAGSWSVYPYFGINKILVSNMAQGLFVLNYNGQALPITLADFTVSEQNGNALLKWSTSSEINNQQWQIERSVDGEQFYSIGSRPGAGSTETQSNYSFVDQTVQPGMNFYRLKQVDLDGSVSYSHILSLNIEPISSTFTVFPTLLDGERVLQWRSPSEFGKISMYSLDGLLVYHADLSSYGGQVSLDFLPAGQYVVRLSAESRNYLQKVMLLP